MKCTIPEISWHNRDPVLSIDIQPQIKATDPIRLATGGTDSHVLIWYVTTSDESSATVEIAADLTRHEKAVNAVRWSPSGELLASGDDDNVIMIWKQRTDADPPMLEQNNEADKEIWASLKILRGHLKDVYDISWSPCSQFLISGSVDNTAIMWHLAKGRSFAILDDHKNFVQGVSWDPNNQYVATMSSDRTCRVYDIKTKKIVSRSSKGKPTNDTNQSSRLYHDDTLQSFFRRLCFSPDGMLLVVPSGAIDKEGGKVLHTTYVYSKYSFKTPIITLPSKEYSIAAKFSPVLFCLRNSSPVVPLPYRMIIAVATRCSVILYDTEQTTPFAVISNIHYTRLTDISWSADGTILAVSSTDGFCSIITFSKNELGEVYQKEGSELKVNADIKRTNDSPKKVSHKENKMSIYDESAIDGMDVGNEIITKENLNLNNESTDDIRLIIEDTQTEEKELKCNSDLQDKIESMDTDVEPKRVVIQEDVKSENKSTNLKVDKPASTRTPRRVNLITLSSPKFTKTKEETLQN